MMFKTQVSILFCESDPNLAMLVSEYLSSRHYVIDCVANGKEGADSLLTGHYDLCLTEAVLPQMDGIEMIKEVRTNGKDLPIIVISERIDKEDILAGYHAGCDDYVAKPFSMDVLFCKIEALLRRMRIAEQTLETTFQLGTMRFDSVQQTLNGKRLSGRENDLLLMLCRHNGQLVERSHILKSLWSQDNYFTSRSLSVYVNHLRNYLSHEPTVRIMAVHGKGYKIVMENS